MYEVYVDQRYTKIIRMYRNERAKKQTDSNIEIKREPRIEILYSRVNVVQLHD